MFLFFVAQSLDIVKRKVKVFCTGNKQNKEMKYISEAIKCLKFCGWVQAEIAFNLHFICLFISFAYFYYSVKRLPFLLPLASRTINEILKIHSYKLDFWAQQVVFNFYFSCIMDQIPLLVELGMFTRGKSTFSREGKVSIILHAE